MICYLFEEPTYFFFASDIPGLLYYSHIPTTVIALLFGLFVFFNDRHRLLNQLLLLITVFFSLWTLSSLTAWTNIHADLLFFIWPIFGISAAFIAILSIYFVYVFLYDKDVPLRMKFIFGLLLTPVLLLAASDGNVSGFSLTSCDAFGFEALPYKTYFTSLGFLAMTWISVLLVMRYRKAEESFKKQILLMGTGIELFLFSFVSLTFLAGYFVGLGILPDSSIELYSLFSMTIFMIMIGILIVRFKAFNVSMLAAEALTIGLVVLVGSQYAFVDTLTGQILTSITLALVGTAGALLIRSVRREVEQRKQLEDLTLKLEKANKRLKVLDQLKSEFVSIASHQLRSPLTSIRGYSSMLLEGSYGNLSDKAKDAIERIAESSRMMALSVEDYLNVSRIQAGNMKYVYSDFNLPDMASRIVDDIRRDAVKKGLVLSFKSDMKGTGVVHADNGKTMQILHNLINNAIKYTPKGTITVFAHDQGKKIFIDVVDTGIGMSAETITNIFAKFERAKNANEVNVTGTGLGLYVAQKMAQEMKGDIEAFSDGEGKGSTFRLTLPLQM